MANAVEHSSLYTSSEHALPAACSASCYDRAENVPVLPVVVAKRKLRQIQRQVVLGDIMECPDHAALKQAPERLKIVGMHVPAYIFFSAVIHRLMREGASNPLIALRFIGSDQRNLIAYGLTNELTHRQTVGLFDQLADNIALAGNRPNDRHLIARPRDLALFVTMAILVFAADIGFVYFDFAHQLRKARILHRGPNAMAHIPSRPVVAAPDLAMDLHGADALLALGHQINDLEPRPQRVVGVLKNGFCNDREAIAVSSAALLTFTGPVKRAGLERIDLGAMATRALNAIRPPLILQELLAGFFGREASHQRGQGHGGLGGHGVLRCWRDYSQNWRWVSSTT